MTPQMRKSVKIKRLRIIGGLLLLVLTALYIFRFHPQLQIPFSMKKHQHATTQDVLELCNRVLADQGLEGIRNETWHSDSAVARGTGIRYNALWPKDLPAIWFTMGIRQFCLANGNLTCETVEADSGRVLEALFAVPGEKDTLLALSLDVTAELRPPLGAVAFVFRNFANLREAEALRFITSDLSFGFSLCPDQIPGPRIASSMETGRGLCLLELPCDRESWEVILRCHRLYGTTADERLVEANLLAIFKTYPALAGFYFEQSKRPSPDLEYLVMQVAQKLGLTYLYNRTEPTSTDSLAYANGLIIKRLAKPLEVNSGFPDNLRTLIFQATNNVTDPIKGTYLLQSDSTTFETVAFYLPLFQRLNVSVVSPLDLAETVDVFQ